MADNQTASEFWSRQGMKSPEGAFLAEPAIVALELARPLFVTALDQAPLPKETSGLVVRTFENISDRLYEQAAGMLVCLGIGSSGAAETLARTVIEGALNLCFIAAADHEARLLAFFQQFLQEHRRQLVEWQDHVIKAAATPASGRTSPLLSDITRTLSAHDQMSEFVRKLARGFGFEKLVEMSKYWPRSFHKRCEQIGKSSDYLTSYHRLSASTHLNAEETLRWVLGFYVTGTGRDPECQRKLGAETVFFAAMMTRIAVKHYIEANEATCRALNAAFDSTALQNLLTDLSASIEAVALAAGARH